MTRPGIEPKSPGPLAKQISHNNKTKQIISKHLWEIKSVEKKKNDGWLRSIKKKKKTFCKSWHISWLYKAENYLYKTKGGLGWQS